MNKPISPCQGCNDRSETCHSMCGPYKWYQAEQELYRNFMRNRRDAERIDYPDSQLKRMRGQR